MALGQAAVDPLGALSGSLGAVYEIETPENVRFRLERAGLASRALSWSVDVAVMAGLIQLGALLLSPLQLVGGSAVNVLTIVTVFLVQWWYGALCEWRFDGRTVGKWVVGIAARDQRGLRLTLYQTAIRNLLRIVDLVPGLYLVGGSAALLDRHGRRLGDLAAGTLVIRTRTRSLPVRSTSTRPEELARYPHWVEVSRRLDPLERAAVLALYEQRDALPVDLRIQLFEQLASHLELRYGLLRPPHLSAEKSVLYAALALHLRA
jgi:uncharacterized RDD family membrane protein YckC